MPIGDPRDGPHTHEGFLYGKIHNLQQFVLTWSVKQFKIRYVISDENAN